MVLEVVIHLSKFELGIIKRSKYQRKILGSYISRTKEKAEHVVIIIPLRPCIEEKCLTRDQLLRAVSNDS